MGQARPLATPDPAVATNEQITFLFLGIYYLLRRFEMRVSILMPFEIIPLFVFA